MVKFTFLLSFLIPFACLVFFLPLQTSPGTALAILGVALAGYGLLGWLFLRSHNRMLEKQHLIESMAGSIPDGVYIVNKKYRYTFVSINTARFRPLFPEPSSLIGKDYREHMRSLGVKPEESSIIQALEKGLTFHNVRIDFGPYILSYDTMPLRHPRTGKIIGAAACWRDVTEEEQATFRLKELKSQYKTLSKQLQILLDTIPLSVLYIDKDAVITAVNHKFASYYPEYSKEQLVGMNCREFSVLRGINFETSSIARALNGETIMGEYTPFQENAFLTYSFPIYSPETGHIAGAAAIYQDITEIERLRTELTHMESLSLVGQMAASITHEIRNPMAVIQGFVQLLQRRNEGMFHGYYDIILEELNRANEIINDFLALAQNRIVEMKEAHLNETVRSLEPIILADANLRGISLRMELQDGLPPILMNGKEIKQLLLNLSRNALEAMPANGLLTIRTERAGTAVRLILTDTGPGIPKDKLDKIFQPFYSTKEKGTGLGLPVCSSIVKKHGGTMEIDSDAGQGTVVTITFPTANV